MSLINGSNPRGCGETNNDMKTENLTKACHSIEFLCDELREAHRDALTSGNRFESDFCDLMQEAVKLHAKLTVVREAVAQADAIAKKKGRR